MVTESGATEREITPVEVRMSTVNQSKMPKDTVSPGLLDVTAVTFAHSAPR